MPNALRPKDFVALLRTAYNSDGLKNKAAGLEDLTMAAGIAAAYCHLRAAAEESVTSMRRLNATLSLCWVIFVAFAALLLVTR